VTHDPRREPETPPRRRALLARLAGSGTSCASVLRRIDDHVDGLLPAEEAERVRDHLDRCGDCRETALAAKAASTSLAAWGDLDPPGDCFDRILSKIDALPPAALERPAFVAARRPSALRTLRGWAPTAAAAAAVVTAFVLWDGGATRPAPIRGPVGPTAYVGRVGPQRNASFGAPTYQVRLDHLDVNPALLIQTVPPGPDEPFQVSPVDYEERSQEIWRPR